jgi:hypothetical protein
MRAHPDDPSKAWEEAREHPRSRIRRRRDGADEGVRAFVGGVLKTTEKAIESDLAPEERPSRESAGEE